MAFLARDIHEAGTPQLRRKDSTNLPTEVVRHIYYRLLDSFGPGFYIWNRWLLVIGMLDHDTVFFGGGLFRMSVGEVPGILQEIDAGRLCPIGVILVHSMWPWDVFGNHAELVWKYERDASNNTLRLYVYDPNNPGRDDVYIELDDSSPSPSKPIITNGTDGPEQGRIRGFFRLDNYSFVDPSPIYIDGARYVDVQVPSQMTPVSTYTVNVSMINVGTIGWTKATGYRLVDHEIALQGAGVWGIGEVALPNDVDPGQRAKFAFNVTAPSTPGTYMFRWQMWNASRPIGGTPAIPIYIADTSLAICQQLHDRHSALAKALNKTKEEMRHINWSDPYGSPSLEHKRLTAEARGLTLRIASIEDEQRKHGCTPG